MATPAASTPAQHVVDQALHTFEKAVGGRETLIAAFASGAGAVDPDQQAGIDRLLVLLADPEAGGKSLGQLAKAAKLTMPELVRLYKDARVAYAHVEAIEVISSKIRFVVQDIMEQALPRRVVCTLCEGRRVIILPPNTRNPSSEQTDCPQCRGTGESLTRPLLAVQKVALALAGLLQNQTSPLVALNVQNTHHSSSSTTNLVNVLSTFSKMQATSDHILYGQTKAVGGGASPAASASTLGTP